MSGDHLSRPSSPRGHWAEVFLVFLRLGVTSFGGPVAHLGYFREEFVTRRNWLSDAAYADLVALCQFLPGPASSQTGFAIGLMRAGWGGALAAFLAFTLPSALALVLCALLAVNLEGGLAAGILHGLKLTAVAVVAQALWGMYRSLCPDRIRSAIAIAAIAALAVLPLSFGMIGAILLGGLLGAVFTTAPAEGERAAALRLPLSRGVALSCLLAVPVLLLALPALAGQHPLLALFDSFFRAGALVFGGGHVVLPLLETEMLASGQVSEPLFLTGYALAQAVPGPLFTFAAWLGAVSAAGLPGAGVALIAIFLPGFLLLLGVLPFWMGVQNHPGLRRAMQGINAAVVGILAATFYTPVLSGTLVTLTDLAIALALLSALMQWRVPAWAIVVLGALSGAVLAMAA